MPAVNLRFEDLRARDNHKIDRDFFNKRYRLIAEAIMSIAQEVDGVAEDSDSLVSLGLVRVNEVLGPLLAKVQAASEEGFLVAESATSVQLSVGLQTTLEITEGWPRDLFQPTPYVMLSRQGGGVDDWALFSVTEYNRENGGLAGEVVAVNGTIDAAAHDDWVVSATAGIAKTVMETAVAAQAATDTAVAAAATAEQAAADAEAILDSGPVSSVNGQTGVVSLGVGDIPDLTTYLGQKAASDHDHTIDEVTSLQAALDGKSATGHGHEIADVTGLQAALDDAHDNVVVKTGAHTATDRDVVLADTSGGSFAVTLPSTPATGTTVIVMDYAATWAANPVTIARNGETIEGAAEDLSGNVDGAVVVMRFNGATWRVVPMVGANGGIRRIPMTPEISAPLVLTTEHVGRGIPIAAGGSIEIPNAVFSEGDEVTLENNTGGNITITCTITTAYIAGVDTNEATVTLAPRGLATVLFRSGTECKISGNVS